ncbi:hypothetical protein Q9L58_009893 [Maublancomyces gigas]|uniref:Uncharacterized protein n=1 Tax=Discina gigas TaxID=1032678 RepID=A0ABR3G5L2_9PEZI
MTPHEVPRIRADKQLKEFRREANLSWESFNTLWLQVCQVVYSPSHDILQRHTDTSDPIYIDLFNAIRLAGYFSVESRAAWVLGIYTRDPDHDEFTEYLNRLIAYAAQQFIKQIPSGHLGHRQQSAKVARWLTNEEDADCKDRTIAQHPPAPSSELASTLIIRSHPSESHPATTTVADYRYDDDGESDDRMEICSSDGSTIKAGSQTVVHQLVAEMHRAAG